MTLCVLNNGCYTLMKRDMNTPAIIKAVSCPSFTPLIKYGSNLPFISFRLEDDEFVLATETRDLVVTEDGEFAIDLRKRI